MFCLSALLELRARLQESRRRAAYCQPRRFRPGLEAFEERTLLATAVWTGAVDTNWSTPGNWSQNAVPGVNDQAIFDHTAEGLEAVVDLGYGGSLGELQLASGWVGTIALARSLTVARSFDQAGGTLEGSSDLLLNGTSNWTGGTMGGAGSTVVAANRTLNISGDRDKALDTRALVNQGTIIWTGRGSILGSNATVLDNRAEGTLELRSDARFIHVAGEIPANLRNLGIVRKAASSGVSTILGTLTNIGRMEIQSGVLNLGGGGSSTGTFNVGPGSRLAFTDNNFVFDAGTTLSGVGTVQINGGIVTVASANITAQNLQLARGTLTGSGTLTTSGTFDWTGGTQAGSGVTAIAVGATLAISGPAGKTLNTRTLTNAGTVIWTGTGNVMMANASQFTNMTEARFEVRTDSDLLRENEQSNGTFTNEGTLLKSAGISANVITVAFVNTGAVELQTGTLSLGGGGTSRGTFAVQEGAALVFPAIPGIPTFTLDAGTVIGGGGLTEVRGGTVTVAGAMVPVDLLSLASGTLNGAGTLMVNVGMTWTGGTMSGSGVTHIAKAAVLAITGSEVKQLETRTLRNAGYVEWTGTGDLVAGNGSNFDHLSGGFLVIATDANYRQEGDVLASFTNGGYLLKLGEASRTAFTVRFLSTGTVDVQLGILTLSAGGSLRGGMSLFGGTEFQLAGGVFTFDSGAGFTGDGLLRINGGSATISTATVNAVNVDQSAGAVNGAGNLIVTGSYIWTGGEMSGSGATLIPAGGTLTINGTQDKLLNRRTLSNGGTAVWNGAGNLITSNEALLDNLAGATFEIRNDAEVQHVEGDRGTFRNAGTVRKLAISPTLIGLQIINTGNIDVQTGTLILVAGGVSRGRITLGSTALLYFAGGTYQLDTGAALAGSGLAALLEGTLIVNAAVASTSLDVLGGTLQLSASATLAIVGTYTQDPAASLLVGIAGSQPGRFGRLTATGSVTLDGTLDLTRVDDYTPNIGDQFTIITGATRTGGFSTVIGLDLPQERRFALLYSATQLTLITEGISGPGSAPGGGARHSPRTENPMPLEDCSDVPRWFAFPQSDDDVSRQVGSAEPIVYPRMPAARARLVDAVFALPFER